MNGTLAQNLWAATALLVGFAVVMFTLALLWGLTALMARVVARLQRPAPAAAAAQPAAATDPGADDTDIAVLAAAVALLLDRPHRIVRVLPQPSAWGQQGRRDAHSSHRMP